MKSRYRDTGPAPDVVEAALERAQYSCEINGCRLDGERGRGWSLQHRMPRGRGGTRDPRINRLSNLLVVDGSGVTGCHGLIEGELRAAAYEVGWLLHRCACWPPGCFHDPTEQPVWLLRERWVLLTDDGRYVPCDAPEGADDAPT
jgi:hypothetical protein